MSKTEFAGQLRAQTGVWERVKTKQIINGLILLALLLMLGRFATQGYSRMLTNSNSSEGDQGAFLQLSLNLREHGQLTDGTRSPLYAAVLAPLARREWAFFTEAKLVSLGFGLLAIVAVYWLGSRTFDRFTGLLAAYLLSINTEFIVHSATALTESLLVLLFILAWFAMLKALEYGFQSALHHKYWALAGGLAGLAYLAKGSGQLLAVAFLAVAFLFYRFQLFRTRAVWLFLGSYALVASPVWVYNTVHFGSPTFNYAINHQMWMESWNDWHPDDPESLPTLLTYLQSHTPAEIAERLWSGLKAMRNILVKTLWPTRTLKVDRFLLSPVSGFTLAALALLPFLFWPVTRRYVRENQAAVSLTLLVSLIFYLLFAWYVPIVSLGQRFILPVIPLIFILVAHLTGQIGQKMMAQGLWSRRLVLAGLAISLLFQLRWAIRTNLEPMQAFVTQDLFAQDARFNADAATPLAWLAQQSPEPSQVAWGPSGQSLPIWAYSDRLQFVYYPPHPQSLPGLTRNLVEREVDFIIVAPDMVSRYRELLRDAFPSDGARVEVPAMPQGWALAYAYRGIPCEWCVFRLLKSYPPQQLVQYQLGPAIQLQGYDLSQTTLQPGDTLHLTLHWTAETPLKENYTVFTQLLGPDFQLHGQLDQQPINNLWPTGRWQPGVPVADPYAIPISSEAPPGQYLLLAGMYNPQTGERLPVTHEGQPVADNAIILATLTIPNPVPPPAGR
jgi:hypothetical protein